MRQNKNIKFYQKKISGFTLIELLVVISIIGLLSTMAILYTNTARAKARDTKRVADLKQLEKAIGLYYDDNNRYPGSGHYGNISSCFGSPQPLWTDSGVFDLAFTSKYMSALPVEPLDGCYTYENFPSLAYTAWRCYSPSEIIDPNYYQYLFTFNAETNLPYEKYPGLNAADSKRRCLLGPPKQL